VQTLVENAVKFAVTPRREGARIVIRGIAAHGGVRIEVEDDGPGFTADQVADRHGLGLLRARLALLYGEPASLDIDGTAGRTVVAITVPAGAGDGEGRAVAGGAQPDRCEARSRT
jgi:LytS/YehU family sensor histidine kinase